MIRRQAALAAILMACISSCAFAQELTTDAERDWRAIRSSDDTRTKLMAERWYNAIRQQEWGDASGKFATSAKYVEHDPNLEWVKLRVIRGVGKEREVRDVQIPLDKLNKACQARVRTISVLAPKVAEAIEEEATKEAEDDDESAGSRGGEFIDQEPVGDDVDGGRESRERERGVSGPRRARDDRNPPRRNRRDGAQPEEPPLVSNDGPSLPAALPPLPTRSEIGETAIANERSASTNTDAATPIAGGAMEFQHPTSAEQLEAVFEKAFAAGDKDTLEKLFYWDGVSLERRQLTFSNLIDYAGAQLLSCERDEFTDGGSMTDFTIVSATYFNLDFDAGSAEYSMRWPYGEIEGKYYLGAWNPTKRR